jgi:hypothetical protein
MRISRKNVIIFIISIVCATIGVSLKLNDQKAVGDIFLLLSGVTWLYIVFRTIYNYFLIRN